jgi:hypothetical protein
MYPHRIRLRGPWQAEPAGHSDAGDGLPARTVTLPCRWADVALGFTGAVVFRRRFGLPRQIDEWERVWLTCERVEGRSDWRLNDAEVAATAALEGSWEAEVTTLLRDRNELVVRVEGDERDSGLYGEVALEVRCRAYLRGVRVYVHPTEVGWVVHVTGGVVSEHPADPLELYLLIDGKNHDYSRLQSDQWETPFQFMAQVEGKQAGEKVTVRVDLVNGATIWHTVELTAELGEPSNS